MGDPGSQKSASNLSFRASLSLTSDRVNKVFKVLFLGDAGTGKTSLIKQYAHGIFDQKSTAPTVGVDFVAKQIKWDEHLRVNLQIWDIPGSQKGSVITSTFYNFAMGAILVFDATSEEGFKSISAWRDGVNSRICLPNGDFIPFFLVANKCDLEDAHIDRAALDELVKEESIVGWLETSAKTGHNIDEAMRRLVEKILDAEEACAQAMDNGAPSVQQDPAPASTRTCC